MIQNEANDDKQVLIENKAINNQSNQQSDYETDDEDLHNKFNSNFEYLMQTLGLAAGFGSIWRFPYLVYKNGGGVFLIPYFICFFTLTIPCYYLETALGQIYQKGPMKLFPSYGKKYGGLGLFTIILTVFKGSFYNVFLTYSYIFFYYSFGSPLIWSQDHGSEVNEKAFFNQKIIHLTADISERGDFNPWVSFGYAFSYFIVWLCVSKGVKISGIIATYSATAPFFILVILIIKGFYLPGSFEGLSYLFKPDYSKLWSIQLWTEAVGQALFQFSIGSGIIMLFGSYRAKKESLMETTYFVPTMVLLCGFLSAIAVFQVVGYLSHSLKIPISDIKVDGAELIFVVFPMALNMMPLSNLWAIIFFFMMINLGLDTIMAYVEYISSLFEQQKWFKQRKYSQEKFRFLLCASLVLLGQIFCFGNGFHVAVFVNMFLNMTVVLSALINPLFICWNDEYYEHLQKKIKDETGTTMNSQIKFIIKYITIPLLIILSYVSLQQMIAESNQLPFQYKVLGWLFVIGSPLIGMLFIYIVNYNDKQVNNITVDIQNKSIYGTF